MSWRPWMNNAEQNDDNFTAETTVHFQPEIVPHSAGSQPANTKITQQGRSRPCLTDLKKKRKWDNSERMHRFFGLIDSFDKNGCGDGNKIQFNCVAGDQSPNLYLRPSAVRLLAIFIFCLPESHLPHSVSTHVIHPSLSETHVPCHCIEVQCQHLSLFRDAGKACDAHSPKQQTQEKSVSSKLVTKSANKRDLCLR